MSRISAHDTQLYLWSQFLIRKGWPKEKTTLPLEKKLERLAQLRAEFKTTQGTSK